MSEPENTPKSNPLLPLTAQIVSAHITNNTVSAEDMPGFIRSVYSALQGADAPTETQPELQPAVPPRKSVFPDYIICLEDGKKLKMLKRHLRTAYNMTPQEYRDRWGLPREYPMVAPNYAQRRSNLARQFGLGRQAGEGAPVAEPPKKGRRPRSKA